MKIELTPEITVVVSDAVSDETIAALRAVAEGAEADLAATPGLVRPATVRANTMMPRLARPATVTARHCFNPERAMNLGPPKISVTWLQMLGLSKAHAEAVVMSHKDEIDRLRADADRLRAKIKHQQEVIDEYADQALEDGHY